jgi:hypothetical protein
MYAWEGEGQWVETGRVTDGSCPGNLDKILGDNFDERNNFCYCNFPRFKFKFELKLRENKSW